MNTSWRKPLTQRARSPPSRSYTVIRRFTVNRNDLTKTLKNQYHFKSKDLCKCERPTHGHQKDRRKEKTRKETD